MNSKSAAAVKPQPKAAPAAAPAPALDAGTQAIKTAMAEALPPIVALQASEIWAREAGVKFNTWEAVPKAGTPFENLLRPEYWANVSQRMKPGDKIIAFPRDGGWYGELVVWDAGQNWAHVTGGASERPDFQRAPGLASDFDIRTDPIDGVCVVRISTGARIKSNFPNHEDARRWILDHQRALRS